MGAIRSLLARRRDTKRAQRLLYGLAWCDCGAPMARDDANQCWDCSDILKGIAVPSGQPGALRHSDTKPYIFWKVRAAVPNECVRRPPRNQPELA